MSLAAEYETKINKVNQVSIWDRVVESKAGGAPGHTSTLSTFTSHPAWHTHV